MSKLTIVLAAGVGYVLGARAGRERYEAIKSQATRMWRDPRVQHTASQAQEIVQENAPKVQEKVTEVAATAASKVKRTTDKGDSDPAESSAYGTHSSTSPSATGGTHG